MHNKKFEKFELHGCDRSKRTSPVTSSQSLQCKQTPVTLLRMLYVSVFCMKPPATLAYSNRVENVDKLTLILSADWKIGLKSRRGEF